MKSYTAALIAILFLYSEQEIAGEIAVAATARRQADEQRDRAARNGPDAAESTDRELSVNHFQPTPFGTTAPRIIASSALSSRSADHSTSGRV